MVVQTCSTQAAVALHQTFLRQKTSTTKRGTGALQAVIGITNWTENYIQQQSARNDVSFPSGLQQAACLSGFTKLDLQLPPEMLGLSQEVFHRVEDAISVGRVFPEQGFQLTSLAERLILQHAGSSGGSVAV